MKIIFHQKYKTNTISKTKEMSSVFGSLRGSFEPICLSGQKDGATEDRATERRKNEGRRLNVE